VLVPLGDDDVRILINDSLDLLEVTGLDAHPLHKDKLRPVPFELGHSSIPLHMDMQRVMLPTIEEERESEESEYFWHNVFFINYYGKDRNYFQYLQGETEHARIRAVSWFENWHQMAFSYKP